MKDNYEKEKLLVQVAKLYYENDYSQEQIASELNLSRPYVSKLLKAAKSRGLVQIRVIDPLNLQTPLEKRFCEIFSLKKAIIVPQRETGSALKPISEAAARFLNEILEEKDIIATSWGDTMYQLSLSLKSRNDLHNMTYVQLCGGFNNINSSSHAAEIANNFSLAFGCPSYTMQLPAIVGNSQLKHLLEQDPHLSRVMELGKQANVAVFTIGAFGERSALVREGFLSKDLMRTLESEGAVGDICTHVITREGRICDEDLDERTIAISLKDIQNMRYRIGVAQGISKIDAIYGALLGNIMNVLITNEYTAEHIMKKYEANMQKWQA